VPASQGKAIKPLVVAEVAEHWLPGGEASSDHLAPSLGVDLALHPIGGFVLGLDVPA
jgi:hypothetical protein